MGRTYYKASKSFDDEISSKRLGKTARHTNGKKTGGMRTLNNYVEEDYDFEDDVFDDDIELNDNIEIQHTKHKP